MANANDVSKEDSQEVSFSKFCPICGTKMNQEERYGFLCWVCPECDFDEPADI
ncbi:zf-TFIIB domain-containing protein [Cronobacter dublinensis]